MTTCGASEARGEGRDRHRRGPRHRPRDRRAARLGRGGGRWRPAGRRRRRGARPLALRRGARDRRSSPPTFATERDSERLVAEALERHGRIDILCNNAGVGLLKSVTDTERDEYDRVLDTNLWGVFTCSRYAIPHMVAGGGGSVVNIGSVAATVGFATDAAYCASKGAVARPDPPDGARLRPGRRARQLRRARLHRDRAGARLPREPRRPGRSRARGGRSASRWAAWAARRRSQPSSRSSPPTTPRSSPDPPTPSTAGCSPGSGHRKGRSYGNDPRRVRHRDRSGR